MKAIHILLIPLFFLLLFFIGLSDRPLFTPDEGRYAEIAREMVARHDYITPYLNDIKYFEKPALFYWLGAAAIKMGGVTILSVRVVNAVLGLFGLFLVYMAGRRLYNPATSLLAAAILSTSMLYFVMAHMVSLDLPVTVFLTGCLLCCMLAIKHPSQYGYFYLAATFSALAVLTKGLIGVVFPALILGVWIMVMSEWQLLRRLPILRALLLFFLIAVPWHVLVNLHNPEFFNFYFIEQHFLRYTNPEIGHYQPAWFFIPVLIAGFIPWIVFLPQTLWNSIPSWKERRQFGSEVFLLLWAALIFIFFSFSKSKLIPYILPTLPPLALLTARYLNLALNRPRKIGLYMGIVSLFLLASVMTDSLKRLNIPFSHPTLAMDYLYAACLSLLIGSAFGLLIIVKRPRTALLSVIISSAMFLVLLHLSVKYIDTRTIRPLALQLMPILKNDDTVITYNQYFQDLPFYIQRRVSILNWKNELTFGMEHQAAHDWMINNEQFLKLWRSKKRAYMIMSQKEYQTFRAQFPKDEIILLGQTVNNVLVTNHSGGLRG